MDGAFECDGWEIRGHAALREYAEVHARVMRCRHLTLNLLYEVNGQDEVPAFDIAGRAHPLQERLHIWVSFSARKPTDPTFWPREEVLLTCLISTSTLPCHSVP